MLFKLFEIADPFSTLFGSARGVGNARDKQDKAEEPNTAFSGLETAEIALLEALRNSTTALAEPVLFNVRHINTNGQTQPVGYRTRTLLALLGSRGRNLVKRAGQNADSYRWTLTPLGESFFSSFECQQSFWA